MKTVSLWAMLFAFACLMSAFVLGGCDDDDDNSSTDSTSQVPDDTADDTMTDDDDDDDASVDDAADDGSDDDIDDDIDDDDAADDDIDDDQCGALEWPTAWPQTGYLLRMEAAGDTFHVWVNKAESISHVADCLDDSGEMPFNMGIPGADIELNSTFNPGYSYRLKPNEVTFAEVWIELCDATPCYIESDPEAWLANPTQWCPWAALTMMVWDCEGGDGSTCGDAVWSQM